MSMEDILQDPKTTWKEIRSAMRSKGSRHSTNGGIMMAVVTASEVPSSQRTGKEEHKLEDDEDADASSPSPSRDCQFVGNLASHDTLAAVNFGYNPRNTRSLARKNLRRGIASETERDGAALNSSSTSMNAYSVNSSITSASVDMMDFGVDNNAVDYSMETLKESDSKRGTPCLKLC